MNTHIHPTQGKEVTALDADVPLLRPSLIRFNVSELRSIQSLPSRPSARCLLLFNASQTKLLPFCTFGIRFAYPSLKNPEKGASTKLLKQTGGKLAFGKPVDILTWEYTSGKVHKAEWDVPANWANKMISEIEMPEYLIPIIRKRRNNTEVVHADQYWQAGDRIIFLSSTSPARQKNFFCYWFEMAARSPQSFFIESFVETGLDISAYLPGSRGTNTETSTDPLRSAD